MEILLWLVPPVVVTGIAMAWVSWISRDGAGEPDPDVQAARLAAAMQRKHPGLTAKAPVRARDRSTGLAVRPSRSA